MSVTTTSITETIEDRELLALLTKLKELHPNILSELKQELSTSTKGECDCPAAAPAKGSYAEASSTGSTVESKEAKMLSIHEMRIMRKANKEAEIVAAFPSVIPTLTAGEIDNVMSFIAVLREEYNTETPSETLLKELIRIYGMKGLDHRDIGPQLKVFQMDYNDVHWSARKVFEDYPEFIKYLVKKDSEEQASQPLQ